MHPIGHHTSHTMGNGASSSNSGSPSSGGNFTAHTMDNGASSSNAGAHGDGETSNSTGLGQGTGVEATLTNPAANESNNFTNQDDDMEEPSTPSSYANSIAGDDSDESASGINSMATSMSVTNNFTNFNIIDSTLREGEQFVNSAFTTEQKIEIARALDAFGVEYLELTSPAASPRSFADCQAICKLGLKAKVLCHIRCNMDDARAAVEAGVDGINMCIGTSKQLMENSHGKDLDWIAAKAQEVVAYVRANNIEVRFSGEDSFRSDFNEILKLYSLVDRIGANRVGIADTVGGATYMEVYDKVSALRRTVNCDIETHFHNDTGCAVSNALAALEAGATHIDTCVLGIGERNGITSLRGLMAVAMTQEREHVLSKYKMEKLGAIEKLVADCVGVEIPWNNFSSMEI